MSADFDQLKTWAQQDWRAQASFREDAEEEYNFVDGHQWTDQEKADLEANQRAPIVFNRCATVIASVAGSEINNRTEVRYIPREIGDVKTNEVLTAGAEWFRDQAHAEDEESQAFRDLLICGLGWTETKMDFEEDPEGEPTIERIDPLEMFFDCHAHRRGLTDASRIGRVHSLPLAEAREMFPSADDADLDADWLDKASDPATEWNIVGDEYTDGNSEDGSPRDTVTVVQIQWRERVRKVEYVEPTTGERAEMGQEEFDRVQKMIPVPIPHRRINRRVWRQAFIGKTVLKESQPDPSGSTFTAMTGHWDRKDRRFYGLLRSMKDPQKFANKWLSQTLHIINTNAKGGVMAEVGAVSDVREFEESWAAADSVSWLSNGGMERIREKGGPQMPSALMQLTEFAISSIRDVSGVSLELMGMREANQPGVLEYQRRQSAMTTLAGLFDSLRYYRKRQGGTILHFLREHIAPTGRLVRLVKEGQQQYVPLAMDDGTVKYDVIVDDAPSAPNEKEKAWSVIEAMMPMLQNAGLGMEDWADILEYSPLPSSFAEKVREKAESQKKQGPNPAQRLEQAKVKSEIAENEANARLDQVKAQQVAQEAQLAPVKIALDEQDQRMNFVQSMQPQQNPR